MEKIHWAGGLKLPKTNMLKGWPCCCSGQRAEKIKREGMMNHSTPTEVTCKSCINLLRKAGELDGDE